MSAHILRSSGRLVDVDTLVRLDGLNHDCSSWLRQWRWNPIPGDDRIRGKEDEEGKASEKGKEREGRFELSVGWSLSLWGEHQQRQRTGMACSTASLLSLSGAWRRSRRWHFFTVAVFFFLYQSTAERVSECLLFPWTWLLRQFKALVIGCWEW